MSPGFIYDFTQFEFKYMPMRFRIKCLFYEGDTKLMHLKMLSIDFLPDLTFFGGVVAYLKLFTRV